MDPIALATAATALLAPYIAKVADKAADKWGEVLPDQIGKLWGAITEKFKGKPAAEEAVKDLAAKPDDADNQAAFRKELKKTLTDDEGFMADLLKLLQAAQAQHIQTGDTFIGNDNMKVGNNYGTIVHGGDNTENIGVKVNNSQVGGDVTGHDKVTSGK